ncbi:DEAD/DEAH box helicase [Paenibacillus sp. IB182496]|uniref:DEAD/DEAH box helicase n=2 Tax=Paenibacillus sabuli TaxID=2772509 RepID=A0A927GRS9_9BACL|nr:DEAD/DEAH box helicase [Paenibacillus sabuli]
MARFLGGWSEADEDLHASPDPGTARVASSGAGEDRAADAAAAPRATGRAEEGPSRAADGEASDGGIGADGNVEDNTGSCNDDGAPATRAAAPGVPAPAGMPGGEADAHPHPLGYRPRPVAIVASAMDKRIELIVTMPDYATTIADSREAVWVPLLERLVQLMDGARSVLIFVNSRRLCERLCLRLNDHVGYEMARAHHGSLDRARRLEVERQLQTGELRAIVATSSLELGIDVGHIDLVIQVDSPLDAASGIQRIGRAGHGVGEASRGAILVRERGALPESALLAQLIAQREIEPIRLPEQPLDVLSQQTVAMAALDDWSLETLHRLVCRSACYCELSRERLEAMLRVLGGTYPIARPLLEWDPGSERIARRRNTAMAALTGSGTIPQSSGYPVHHAETRAHLGELDEEFVEESRTGDVFQLGTSSWMIREIRHDRVYVGEAPNNYSEIPFWRAEGGEGGRSAWLAARLGALLERLDAELAQEARERAETWLQQACHLDHSAAERLVRLLESQRAACAVPTARRIVVEHYRDLMQHTHVVVHSPWGRRINRTWLLAIERQLQRLLPYRPYGNATNDGIELVLREWDPSWLRLITGLAAEALEPLLLEGLPGSALLAIAFRRIAETSLLLARSFTRTPLWQLRLRSEELLKEALPYADQFPYLDEAVRTALYRYLDLDGLRRILTAIAAGEIELVVRQTPHPSPLAAQFVSEYASRQLYEGDGLDEALQLQLRHLSKDWALRMPGASRRETGGIDPEVLAHERERLAAPQRQPDGTEALYALLKARGDLSRPELERLAGEQAGAWLQELERSGRVCALRFGAQTRWICADEQALYAAFPETPAAIALVAGRFAEHRLAIDAQALQARYPALLGGQAERVLEELLRQDKLERAPFAATPEEPLWSSRKVAARLVRLSIQEARKRARPLQPERWLGQMAALQHALAGTQLQGEDGLRQVIARLQGLYLPLSHWETLIFPARLQRYRREALDLLCASGEVLWLGRKHDGDKEGRVAFFLAESHALYAPLVARIASDTPAAGTSGEARERTRHPALLERLRTQGASFLTRLARETGQLPSELLGELLELVWEGRVSNDQFAPLRLHAGAKPARLKGTGSGQGRWYWTGTLAAAHADEPAAAPGPRTPAQDHVRLARIDADYPDEPPTSQHASAPPGGSGTSAPPETSHAGAQPGSTRASGGPEQSAAAWIQHLVQSYGLITRELAAGACPYSWDKLLPMLKRLEEWGVMTRGRFIQGVESMQFTSRELAEQLRQPRAQPQAEGVTVLPAVDPANPYGLLIGWPEQPGAAFARKPGHYLVLAGADWRLWVEGRGRRIYELTRGAQPPADAGDPAEERAGSFADAPVAARAEAPAPDLDTLREMCRQLLALQSLRKLKIERWNGQLVQDTAAGQQLLALGAERDAGALVLWPSQLG